jgi:amidase
LKRVKIDFPKSYTFKVGLKPVLTVEPNETFVVETEDAVSGAFRSESVLFSKENLEPYSLVTPELANPVSGPVYIKGARKGDLLAIHIEKIIPDPQGVTGIKVTQGMFHDSVKWSPIHQKPYTKIVRHTTGSSGDTSDGEVVFSDKFKWKTAPFIGTIGVAPEVEEIATSIAQSPAGGNWDCYHIRAGSTIYINSYHEGGLLFVGDVHGSQGDGELSGIANEIRSEVILRVEVIPNKQISYARIEEKDTLICFCAIKPLEDAIENAVDYLLEWITSEYDLDPHTAYLLFSICPEFKIEVFQLCKGPRISYTAGVSFPKRFLERKND